MCHLDFQPIPDIKNRKNLSENQQKEHEGDLILPPSTKRLPHFIGRKWESPFI